MLNDWHRRLWIFQEVSLAPKNILHCGDLVADLQEILYASHWLSHYGAFTQAALTMSRGRQCAANMFSQIMRRETWPVRYFWSLLESAGFFKSTYVQDKVFGILGMYLVDNPQQNLPSALLPDMERPAAEVLCLATQLATVQCRDLGFFNCTKRRDPNISDIVFADLPSWVPSWFQRFDRRYDAVGHAPLCDACGPLNSPITHESFSNNGRCFSILGFAVDTTSFVSHVITDDVLNKDGRKILPIIDSLGSLDREYVELGTTLIALPRYQDFEARIGYFREFLEYLRLGVPVLQSSENAVSYAVALYKSLNNRRLFKTESGRVGVGPGTTMVGDTVAILQTGQWPFMLRAHSKKKNAYEMVGVCYLDGCANGAFVLEKQAAGQEPELFIIW